MNYFRSIKKPAFSAVDYIILYLALLMIGDTMKRCIVHMYGDVQKRKLLFIC